MSRADRTLEPAYFDNVYAADSDPWKFASSAYERDKYAATLAAFPKPRYASAFEIGCSIGVLTSALAPRCDALLAVDAAAARRAGAAPGSRMSGSSECWCRGNGRTASSTSFSCQKLSITCAPRTSPVSQRGCCSPSRWKETSRSCTGPVRPTIR
jgi:hypothetical protein